MLSTQVEAAKITHAQQQAWGTNGLRPQELRAILHALTHTAVVTGRPAVQFKEQLKQKVRELPPEDTSAAKQAVLRL